MTAAKTLQGDQKDFLVFLSNKEQDYRKDKNNDSFELLVSIWCKNKQTEINKKKISISLSIFLLS